MKRGEIWRAELAEDAGFRPIAIVSRTPAMERRLNITIAEVTRTIRSSPNEVPLSIADGMPTTCVINTDSLHTIPRNRLRERITSLSAEAAFSLNRALRYSLDIEW